MEFPCDPRTASKCFDRKGICQIFLTSMSVCNLMRLIKTSRLLKPHERMQGNNHMNRNVHGSLWKMLA